MGYYHRTVSIKSLRSVVWAHTVKTSLLANIINTANTLSRLGIDAIFTRFNNAFLLRLHEALGPDSALDIVSAKRNDCCDIDPVTECWLFNGSRTLVTTARFTLKRTRIILSRGASTRPLFCYILSHLSPTCAAVLAIECMLATSAIVQAASTRTILAKNPRA